MNDEGTGRNGSRAVRIWLNPASDYTAEVIHPVEPQAEVAEEAERLLAMLAELALARQFVALANEREPHPVRARHSLKALRQIERQMVAELEELYGRPVEIDPPRTAAPSNGARVETKEVPMNQTADHKVTGAEINEPGRIRRAADATWRFAKSPKVWGTAAVVAGIAVVYAVVKMVSGGSDAAADTAVGG